MQALRLLDEFVEESEAVGEFRGPFCVFVHAGVNEFLEESVLVVGVDAETRDPVSGRTVVIEGEVLTHIRARTGEQMWW